MTFLSLRGTISALSACCVAVVAIITLSITLTTSLQALRDIGKTHATALLANARLQTEDLFDKPARATETIRNITMSAAWAWPSDDPTVLTMYMGLVRDQFLSNSPGFALGLHFYDNTRFGLQQVPWDATLYGGSLVQPAPFSTGGIAYQRTQPIRTQLMLYNWTTHLPSPSGNPVSLVSTLVRDSAVWTGTFLAASNGGLVTAMPGVILTVVSGIAFNWIPVVVPLYRNGTTTKGPNSLYAFAFVTLETVGVSDFLRSVGGTANTASFAYDGNGHLIGSSLTKPFTVLTSAPLGQPVPNGTGCATTAATSGASAAASTTLSYSSCRTHIASYGFEPLSQLASDTSLAFFLGNTVDLITVNGDIYFAAVTKVKLPYPGIGIWTALLMPEEDVIGDVVTGRNMAIGITCAVFVVVAALSFVLISLLLRPLSTIADRMMLAASLADDGSDDGKVLSSMAEVKDLQQAYYAMNEELIRIRSFVPQTVRMKRFADDEETSDDDVAAVATANKSQASRSNRQSPSVRSGSKRSSGNGAVAGLNVACGLANQSVSVVVANLNGFEARANDSSRDVVVEGVAETVKMVHGVVTAQKGVLLSFHGDHFIVVFNAVTPCAAHARRAALSALHLAREARGVGLHLGLRAGVATGRCLVGNLGSAEAKCFSTIGTAFTHASILERLTRVYGSGCQVLATKRTCVDVSTHVAFRYVDVVQLPRQAGPTLVGALLGETSSEAQNGVDQEWLYVVESAGTDAVINETFDALFDGKFDTTTVALLGKTLSKEDVQSHHVHSRVLEARDTVVSKGASSAPVRDLGLLYRAGYGMLNNE